MMDSHNYTMGDGSVRKLSEVVHLSYVRDCQPGEQANLVALETVDARGQTQVLMKARRRIVADEDLTCSFGLNGLLQSPPAAGDWFHRRRSSSARYTPRQRVPTPAPSGFPGASKTKKRGKITSTPDKPPKPPDDDLMPVERDERVGGNTVDGGGGHDHKTPKGKSR